MGLAMERHFAWKCRFRDELLAERAEAMLPNQHIYQKSKLDNLLPLIENPQLRDKFAKWPLVDPFGGPRGENERSVARSAFPSQGQCGQDARTTVDLAFGELSRAASCPDQHTGP